MKNILFLFLTCTLLLGCYASKESPLDDNYLCDHPEMKYDPYRIYKNIKRNHPLIDTSIFKGISLVYNSYHDGGNDYNEKLYILNPKQGNLFRILGEGEMKLVKKDVFKEVNMQEFDTNLAKLKGVNFWIACDGFSTLDAFHDNFWVLEDGKRITDISTTSCYNFEHVDVCPPLDERQAVQYMYKIAFGSKYKEYKKYDRR